MSLARRLRTLDRSPLLSGFRNWDVFARQDCLQRVLGEGMFSVAELSAVSQHAALIDDERSGRDSRAQNVRCRSARIESNRQRQFALLGKLGHAFRRFARAGIQSDDAYFSFVMSVAFLL